MTMTTMSDEERRADPANHPPPPLPDRTSKPNRRLSRSTQASEDPYSGSIINAVYPDAIECAGLLSSAGVKGFGLFAALSALLGWVAGWVGGIYILFDDGFFTGIIGLAAGTFFLGAAITFLRLDLFSYRDEPVLFNRRTKKVHVFRRRKDMMRPWKPWPLVIDTYDWNQITGEIQGGGRLVGGSVPGVRYRLVLAVSEEPTARGKKSKVIDEIIVGMEESAAYFCLGRWEHLRRYMEEDGPPLQPGGELALTRGFSHRLALARGGLFLLLPGFYKDFPEKPWGLVLGTLAQLILLPMLLIFAIFRWLAEVTSRDPWWPRKILEEAGGAPLPEDEVLAQAGQIHK